MELVLTLSSLKKLLKHIRKDVRGKTLKDIGAPLYKSVQGFSDLERGVFDINLALLCRWVKELDYELRITTKGIGENENFVLLDFKDVYDHKTFKERLILCRLKMDATQTEMCKEGSLSRKSISSFECNSKSNRIDYSRKYLSALFLKLNIELRSKDGKPNFELTSRI